MLTTCLTLALHVPALNQFFSGAIVMALLVAGLFFLRFWRKTRDRLFAIFALAFWVMGINRIAVVVLGEEDELRGLIYYTIRLIAFLLIFYAIIDKNLATRKQA